nr:isochorismatase family protein [Glaciimonas sp. PCH181]
MGQGIGLGDHLPEDPAFEQGGNSAVLQKGSWGAALVDELIPAPGDICVDKLYCFEVHCFIRSG